MKNSKVFLVNLVIPYSGDSVTVEEYKAILVGLGYSEELARKSLGGISGRSADIVDGNVTRR